MHFDWTMLSKYVIRIQFSILLDHFLYSLKKYFHILFFNFDLQAIPVVIMDIFVYQAAKRGNSKLSETNSSEISVFVESIVSCWNKFVFDGFDGSFESIMKIWKLYKCYFHLIATLYLTFCMICSNNFSSFFHLW